MREIKFRAWEKTSELMVYDIQNVSRKRIIGESACESFQEVLDSWEYETMQYTGLKDKNGREIYEGDVVRHASDDGVYKVIFEDGGFYVKSLIEYDFQTINEYPLEIIGNIYENPELLGGEEND